MPLLFSGCGSGFSASFILRLGFPVFSLVVYAQRGQTVSFFPVGIPGFLVGNLGLHLLFLSGLGSPSQLTLSDLSDFHLVITFAINVRNQNFFHLHSGVFRFCTIVGALYCPTVISLVSMNHPLISL